VFYSTVYYPRWADCTDGALAGTHPRHVTADVATNIRRADAATVVRQTIYSRSRLGRRPRARGRRSRLAPNTRPRIRVVARHGSRRRVGVSDDHSAMSASVAGAQRQAHAFRKGIRLRDCVMWGCRTGRANRDQARRDPSRDSPAGLAGDRFSPSREVQVSAAVRVTIASCLGTAAPRSSRTICRRPTGDPARL